MVGVPAGDLGSALAVRNIDWKRFLGLVMWYQLGPDTDIPSIIDTYEELLDQNEAPRPIPKYVEEGATLNNTQVDCDIYDTTYYLMLLHAEKGKDTVNTMKMLSSSSSTFDRLDHRLAWHQQGLLHAIGVLETQQLTSLHMNFVSQLLSVGLCHWALYVVLHMPWSSEHPGLHEKVSCASQVRFCAFYRFFKLWNKNSMDKMWGP